MPTPSFFSRPAEQRLSVPQTLRTIFSLLIFCNEWLYVARNERGDRIKSRQLHTAAANIVVMRPNRIACTLLCFILCSYGDLFIINGVSTGWRRWMAHRFVKPSFPFLSKKRIPIFPFLDGNIALFTQIDRRRNARFLYLFMREYTRATVQPRPRYSMWYTLEELNISTHFDKPAQQPMCVRCVNTKWH